MNVVACRFLFAILGMKIKGLYMVKRTNNNDMSRVSPRGNRIAAKVQTLVAEILRDKYMDDAVLNKVSLVGADAHDSNWRRVLTRNIHLKLNFAMTIQSNAPNELRLC